MGWKIATQQLSSKRTSLPSTKSAPALLRSRAPAYPLQTTIGNLAITRLLRAGHIQPKLTLSNPGDASEREADRVADQVMRMPEPQGKTTSSVERLHSTSLLQRKCAACDAQQEPEEEVAVQRKQIGKGAPGIKPEAGST